MAISQQFACDCGNLGWITDGKSTGHCPQCGRIYRGQYNPDTFQIDAIEISEEEERKIAPLLLPLHVSMAGTFICDRNGETIAKVYMPPLPRNEAVDLEISDANVVQRDRAEYLVLAATAYPDLLEACKLILDGYDNPDQDGAFDWPGAAEKIRAAIAKATS